MRSESGEDADDRARAFHRIHNHGQMRTRGIRGLIGAHGNENAAQMLAEYLEGALQLGLAPILERRFVALHAFTCAARENETINWIDAHGATA